MTAEEARNVALCQGIRDAINGGDVSIIDRVMAPDFQDHHPGLGDRVTDRERYKQALAYVHETLQMQARVDFTLASGPYVVTRVTLTGRHVGAFLGVAPTGREVVWSTIEIYRAADGLLRERWALDDMAGLFRQMGVPMPVAQEEMHMKTFTMTIRARRDRLAEVVRELSYYDQTGRGDAGNVVFQWLQHEGDPLSFTLFEQWSSQQALDAHLRPALIERWQALQPLLDGAPAGVPLRPLAELTRAVSADEVRPFAARWFGLLNAHPAVEEVLPLLAEQGLWMRFPERTLQSLADFRAWWDDIGQQYRDQSHDIESVTVEGAEAAEAGRTVQVVVVWRATRTATGERLAVRATQRWTLARSLLSAAPVIVRYDVERTESADVRA